MAGKGVPGRLNRVDAAHIGLVWDGCGLQMMAVTTVQVVDVDRLALGALGVRYAASSPGRPPPFPDSQRKAWYGITAPALAPVASRSI